MWASKNQNQDSCSASLAAAGQDYALDFHGDIENIQAGIGVKRGLIDLAVNIRPGALPDWLVNELCRIDDLTAYPNPKTAIETIASHHQIPTEMVLPTAGGAEAFLLIAKVFGCDNPVVVHPQFTEPEAALRNLGLSPRRVILPAETGFGLDPDLVPEDAGLVFVGNPTNPTSCLHAKSTLKKLCRAGRVVVVDEVFMDTVAGESESVISADMPGLLVIRSITKLFSIPGVRAGYLIGDPALIAKLKRIQQLWSVSAQGLRALTACLSETGWRWGQLQGEVLRQNTKYLADRLAQAGIKLPTVPRAPFVLIDTGVPNARQQLLAESMVVRRAETFPGLSSSWIRVASRNPQISDVFVAALQKIMGQSLA